jgi:hypothetical protein
MNSLPRPAFRLKEKDEQQRKHHHKPDDHHTGLRVFIMQHESNFFHNLIFKFYNSCRNQVFQEWQTEIQEG